MKYKELFMLESGMDFLNNGSFGACPVEVLDEQKRWRDCMESQPLRFFLRELPKQLRSSAESLGAAIGSNPDNIAWVENATTGANAVIRSLIPTFKSGDILLTTDHCYGAVLATLQYAAAVTGAEVAIVDVPFPIANPKDASAAVIERLSDKVTLVVFDHITSASGIIFPVEEVVETCRERSIPILIDGAHAPGMVPLNLDELNADWYVGNCHKWMFAPKGCAFLWTHPSRQAATHPTVISHGYGQGYLQEFDFSGTKDYSPMLSLPTALNFYRNFGVQHIQNYNRSLVLNMREQICKEWNIQPPAPENMIGFMATVSCPFSDVATLEETLRVHDMLWDNHQIEVPIVLLKNRLWLRISAQIYNEPSDYSRLIALGKF